MYNKSIILLCLSQFFYSSTSVQLPSSFKRCDRKQSDFKQCLVTAVNDALHQLNKPFPEVGLPSIEPFTTSISSVPAGKTTLLFKQNYKNFTMHGFTTGQLITFDVNFENKTIDLEVAFEDISATFDYEFNGKLLLVPIRGEGPGSIAAKNINFQIKFTLEEYEKQGNAYFKVIDTKVEITEPEKLTMNFSNLIRNDLDLGVGGLGLGDVVDPNVILNKNAIRCFHDVKKGYLDGFAVDFGAVLNKFLENVSTSELFGNRQE